MTELLFTFVLVVVALLYFFVFAVFWAMLLWQLSRRRETA